jgi:protoporphyrinogen oxidase
MGKIGVPAKVAIIGGGAAGLSAAWKFQKEKFSTISFF